jgi:hypothetical protein
VTAVVVAWVGQLWPWKRLQAEDTTQENMTFQKKNEEVREDEPWQLS